MGRYYDITDNMDVQTKYDKLSDIYMKQYKYNREWK